MYSTKYGNPKLLPKSFNHVKYIHKGCSFHLCKPFANMFSRDLSETSLREAASPREASETCIHHVVFSFVFAEVFGMPTFHAGWALAQEELTVRSGWCVEFIGQV